MNKLLLNDDKAYVFKLSHDSIIRGENSMNFDKMHYLILPFQKQICHAVTCGANPSSIDYIFLWDKGYKSNAINNLSHKELNRSTRKASEIKDSTLNGKLRDIYLEFFILTVQSCCHTLKLALGEPICPAKTRCSKACHDSQVPLRI